VAGFEFGCGEPVENVGARQMTEDNRLPDHSRLVYGLIWGLVLVVAIPLVLFVIFAVLFSDVMH
jgi:hypothetical protein